MNVKHIFNVLVSHKIIFDSRTFNLYHGLYGSPWFMPISLILFFFFLFDNHVADLQLSFLSRMEIMRINAFFLFV